MEGYDGIAKLADVLFNGRAADSNRKPKVTIEELIKRGTSYVTVEGKLYCVTVTKAELK